MILATWARFRPARGPRRGPAPGPGHQHLRELRRPPSRGRRPPSRRRRRLGAPGGPDARRDGRPRRDPPPRRPAPRSGELSPARGRAPGDRGPLPRGVEEILGTERVGGLRVRDLAATRSRSSRSRRSSRSWGCDRTASRSQATSRWTPRVPSARTARCDGGRRDLRSRGRPQGRRRPRGGCNRRGCRRGNRRRRIPRRRRVAGGSDRRGGGARRRRALTRDGAAPGGRDASASRSGVRTGSGCAAAAGRARGSRRPSAASAV